MRVTHCSRRFQAGDRVLFRQRTASRTPTANGTYIGHSTCETRSGARRARHADAEHIRIMMIKHDEKAIKEGRHCLDKAYHTDLRELCENIISTQSAEIAQMQTWLCRWYGECR